MILFKQFYPLNETPLDQINLRLIQPKVANFCSSKSSSKYNEMKNVIDKILENRWRELLLIRRPQVRILSGVRFR